MSDELTPTSTVSPRAAFDAITADDLNGLISPKLLGKDSPEATPEPVEVDSADEPVTPPAPTEKKELPTFKSIKAFLEGQDPIDLREDAKIDVLVNGVPKRMTVREILDRQSSVENTDREYSKLRKEKEVWANYITDILKQSNDGKALQALTKAMADQGHDPITFIRKLRAELADQAGQWSSLSEEQKKLIELEEENNYHKSRLETQAEASKRKQEEEQLLGYVSQVETQYGMPPGSWHDYHEVMVTEQKAGRIPPGDITIQQVGEFYNGVQAYNVVTATVKELAPHLAEDKQVIGDLLTSYRMHGLSKEDLADVVRELYSPKEETPAAQSNGFDAERAGRNLSEKVQASQVVQKQAPRSDGETANRTVRRPRELW